MVSPLNELRDFCRFLGEKIYTSDMPCRRRTQSQNGAICIHCPTAPEDLEAIQKALDDIENGDAGIPFEEFAREFRARHGLPRQS